MLTAHFGRRGLNITSRLGGQGPVNTVTEITPHCYSPLLGASQHHRSQQLFNPSPSFSIAAPNIETRPKFSPAQGNLLNPSPASRLSSAELLRH